MLAQPRTLFFDAPTGANPAITHRIAVHEWGDSNASETVICVHGLTRNARDFDALALYLSPHYRVLCIDIAGRGKSEWLADANHYNYPQYVADVVFILTSLAITRAHWVGTSMGGIIGMMIAGALPALLQTLTINDIGCLVPAAGLQRITSYVAIPPIFATREQAEAELRSRCAPYGIPSDVHWQHVFAHSIEQMSNGRFRLAYDPAIAQNFPPIEMSQDVNLWGVWPSLQHVPVLLLRGEESDILPAEVAAQMRMTHPNLHVLEVPHIGHAPSLMDDAQIAAIADWIRQ